MDGYRNYIDTWMVTEINLLVWPAPVMSKTDFAITVDIADMESVESLNEKFKLCLNQVQMVQNEL